MSAAEIIYNPNNHMYFAGVKFCSMGVLKKMKEKRNEPKDVNDIKLMGSVTKDTPTKIIFTR